MMNSNENIPKNQDGSEGASKMGNELDMGNDLSMGSGSGTGISDFNPEKDLPETEEKEYREVSCSGDDQFSDDNGINPAPAGYDPGKVETKTAFEIENADEDKLNPFPDELKPNDDDEEKLNSTWMISGRNRKI